MKMAHAILVFSSATIISACSEQYRHYQYLDGPEPTFVVADVEAYSSEQNRYLIAFAQMAGFFTYESEGSPVPVGDPLSPDDDVRWKEVARAGMNYIDRECARYIDAIFWYDRAATTVSSQINITGAATTGIMGLAGMAAESLAITAIAFGFASESVDNIVNSVLYQLNPSTVRAIVAEAQEAYRDEFERKTYNSRQGAVAAIRGYLSVCLPPSIETTVNTAIMNANIEGGSVGAM